MKKILYVAAIALTAMTSCQKGSMKPVLDNDVDTISYEVGVANSVYAETFLQQAALDSTFLEEFMAGVKESTMGAQDKKKLARYLGIMFGVQSNMQIEGLERDIFGADSTQHLSRRNYIAGIANGLYHRSNMLINGQPVDAQVAGMDVQGRVQAIRMKQFEAVRKAGQEFLAQNAHAEGVQVTESGLQYKVLSEGTGDKPSLDSPVQVYYEGRTIDGNIFDSNYGQETPMPCVPGQMIKGFGEALTLMPVGSEWEIYIPAELGYGDHEAGAIQPGSVLIFKVKLVAVTPKN